jgi:hypothetical protein
LRQERVGQQGAGFVGSDSQLENRSRGKR